MSEFRNSIAQANVQFPIETVIEPVAGENYSRALIFMPLAEVADNFVSTTGLTAGKKVELTSSNYGEVTKGLLQKWLVPFFTNAPAALLGVAIFDVETTDTSGSDPVVVPAVSDIATTYATYKYWAYFKFGFSATDYAGIQRQLGELCLVDPLYSQLWVGTSDSNVLTGTSTLMTALTTYEIDARVIYNPNANINPALAQLGDSLEVVNASGTPVGNDVDMHAFSGIAASGSTDADGNVQNLSVDDKAALDEQKIGYNTWVGDGTENVVTEGSMTIKGNVVGAQWVKNYIEYMCKMKAANFITLRNRFRNNDQYQAILAIVSDVVTGFIAFGRLAEFKITAPLFSSLPVSADSIVVPNAWNATYIDKIRSVAVYGTLYITQPSK